MEDLQKTLTVQNVDLSETLSSFLFLHWFYFFPYALALIASKSSNTDKILPMAQTHIHIWIPNHHFYFSCPQRH